MKPKHTSGPWVAVQTNLVTTKRAWESQDLGTLKHAFQATISLQEGESQAEANARLIAAAPEMLEALETIMNKFAPRGTEGLSGQQQLAIGLVMNAIAKATGGEG